MLAPIDKLRNGGNQNIQIIVTSRCDLRCSNCTQSVAHSGNKYNISLSSFREACESLRDWPGIVGVFGGNPTTHKQFPELCAILCEVIPDQRHRGLWSNNLLKHGSVVRDTFYPHGTFNLNAHGNAAAFADFERWVPGKAIKESGTTQSWHSPILTAIEDFVGSEYIPDRETMWAIIKNCPINNDWSGGIIERNGVAKGYFCEVAAAFDILYDEDNGIPVYPQWWKSGIERFENQIERWCPSCGVPLNLKGSMDLDDTDTYSKTHEQLVQIKPYRKATLIESLHQTRTERATDYMRRWSKEINV